MPSTYLKSGQSHTREYKNKYARIWRKKARSKILVAENNLRYWQKRVIELRQAEGSTLSDIFLSPLDGEIRDR